MKPPPKRHFALLTALLMGSSVQAEGLKDLLKDRNLLIGAAVDVRLLLEDPDYTDILERDFNVLVAENGMKMGASQPGQGEFTFTQGDLIYAYASKNNMKLRGHTLLWHEQVPNWITSGTWTQEQLEDIMKTHIQTVASHYRGKVYAWDVVNEAISDSGGYRETLWQKTLGEAYLARAFKYARAADPDAKLFYNDYNSEGLNRKSDEIYAMVKKLKAEGVPIDGVGMQMHLTLNAPPSMAEVAANMKRLAELGLEVHITEFDVRAAAYPGTPEERRAALAKLYGDVLRVCLQASNCTTFITWGITDANSWLKGDSPLLYDGFYKPKPAYFEVQNVLKNPVAPVAETSTNTVSLPFAQFTGPALTTAQGGEVVKMSYNEKAGDASIQSLTVQDSVVKVQYTLGKAAGSSYAGAGVVVKALPGNGTLDLKDFKTLTLQVAADQAASLRIRVAGNNQSVLDAGCYPVKYLNVTSNLQKYTLNLKDFSVEPWCSQAAPIQQVLNAVASIEVADIDLSLPSRQGSIRLGSIELQK